MRIPFPIYVINMSKDVERWISVQKQAIDLELNLNQVVAVESKDVGIEDLEFVTSGVRAVWKSHMKCMSLFLDSNFSHSIIAEDDFRIDSPEQLISTLQCQDILDYDVVQLGWIVPGLDNRLKSEYSNWEHSIFRFIYNILVRFRPKSRILERLRVKNSGHTPKGFVPDDFQPGGHFYLISRRFAHSILKMNEPQFLATDDLYIALARMRSLKFIRTRRSLVSQKPFEKWSGSRFSNH